MIFLTFVFYVYKYIHIFFFWHFVLCVHIYTHLAFFWNCLFYVYKYMPIFFLMKFVFRCVQIYTHLLFFTFFSTCTNIYTSYLYWHFNCSLKFVVIINWPIYNPMANFYFKNKQRTNDNCICRQLICTFHTFSLLLYMCVWDVIFHVRDK